MNKKMVKEAIEGLLQFGWMWGYPKHIKKEHWDALHIFYKTEFNGEKDFKPDKNNRAKP
tara:strand:+ start:6928 stop:7104 length:177 start_codon:yes stop_codon:yes gene_type:complete